MQTSTSLPSAQAIAQSMTTREYFLTEQSKLLQEWQQKSLQLFNNTGQVLKKEYQLKCSNLTEENGNQFDELYDRSRKEFQAFCILNRKVQKKGDQIENFAGFFNGRNHKKNFFTAWKNHSLKMKYIRRMQERSQAYQRKRILKTCLKEWQNISMKNIRSQIKTEVLQKTEIQISRIQDEYQKIIKGLEEGLEKKLLELQKEEEEHKILHDKYEQMVQRSGKETS